MDYGLIGWTYVQTTIVFICVCFCIRGLFNKRTNINPNRAFPPKREFVIKYSRRIDIIARIIMGVFTIVAISYIIVPAISDLPYVVNEKYITMQCKTISHDNVGNVVKTRTIQVIDMKTKKITELKVNYTPIEKNEYFTINYLPHLKIGKIIYKK